MTWSLLEYLAYQTGCAYLSDLRLNPCGYRLRHILSKIPLADCTEREWLDAAQYLCPESDCANASEARTALLALP